LRATPSTPALERQRIDKWLWHARVVRTRSQAAALAAAGHVRINGQRIDAPSRPVRAGDVVTVALDRAVRVLKVVAFAERRGSADDARALCATIEPPPVRPAECPPPPGLREPGAGRPTKRERRAIERLREKDEG
jgi:ribosome-associated heat shock protein Hsp15